MKKYNPPSRNTGEAFSAPARRFFSHRLLLGFLLLAVGFYPLRGQDIPLPENFIDQRVDEDWPFLVGLTFDEEGRMYAWSKAGVVYLAEAGQRMPEPLLDISEEVANWSDFGLLGFALHPNFRNNGYFYLLYVVDRHHLLYHGTPDYDPAANLNQAPTIGRLTRYTADPATGFTRVLPGSRKVLIGETAATGFPLLHNSHGIGSLVFGTDGTLLASCGDGASYSGTDNGGETGGAQALQALAEGIIQPAEDVGAFRSQLLNSLNGKIIRIDSETGDGLPSNPFFDPAAPRAAASRVWALGFRNPYRFRLKPNTGSHEPEEADPGTFFVGDVGWAYWEEINVMDEPGQNFGWPIFEGMRSRWQYASTFTANLTAPNPRHGEADCNLPHFFFQNLIVQEEAGGDPFFEHPCFANQPLPPSVRRFVHQRPMVAYSNMDWNHEEQGTHVPTFDADGQADYRRLDDPDAPVAGENFNGNSANSGVFYTHTAFPEAYHGKFFAADYSGWIQAMDLQADSLQAVEPFFDQAGKNIVDLALNPHDGCLYYISYGSVAQVHKISYGGNASPTAVLTADRSYGPSPLRVAFSAAASFDPEGAPLSYHWDFGDGDSSTEVAPVHEFVASDAAPAGFPVRLTVTDTAGARHQDFLMVSANNTPPEVAISSFEDGEQYPITGYTRLPLQASVTDREHGEDELSYTWQVFFHHNTHFHPEPEEKKRESHALLVPEGCGDEPYWYRIRLTVTDAAGLSTQVEQELFPYCGDALATFDSLSATPTASHVDLRWQVSQAPAGGQFELQRSQDRVVFTSLGTVDIVPEQTAYHFRDPQPERGDNYYRVLTREPQANVYDYSPMVMATFPLPARVEVYPNPFSWSLKVAFRSVDGRASFTLFTPQGEQVLQRQWEGSATEAIMEIDLPRLPAGIYLYQAFDGQQLSTGKLVKMR